MIGTVWRHIKSGHEYEVVGEALIEASLVPVVLYQRYADKNCAGPVWARPVREFMDGRFRQVQRDTDQYDPREAPND